MADVLLHPTARIPPDVRIQTALDEVELAVATSCTTEDIWRHRKMLRRFDARIAALITRCYNRADDILQDAHTSDPLVCYYCSREYTETHDAPYCSIHCAIDAENDR